VKKILLAPLALAGCAVAALAADAAPYNLERAIASQRELLARTPADAAGHNDLGNLLVLAKDHDGARASYLAALSIDPELASAHYNLALLEMKRGERWAAMKRLKRVLEVDPGYAWAHYQVGVIYLDWQVEPLAVRAFARAFRLDPRLAEARVNPHVLDNPLATRALLRAHESADEALLPPRVYQEPARVAAWMIDVPPAPAEEEPRAAEATGGGITRSFSGGARQDAAEVAEAEAADETPKRLTARDLEPDREVNQVGGGAAGIAVIGGGAARGASGETTFGGRRVRTGTTRPGVAPRTPSAGAPSTPPGSFGPVPDSTGRLEIRLLPPEGPEAWASIAAIGEIGEEPIP
jgi:tetratricopeptide (TPR) repeat protein